MSQIEYHGFVTDQSTEEGQDPKKSNGQPPFYDAIPLSTPPPNEIPSMQGIGKPASKKAVTKIDILCAVISLACLAVAIGCVLDNRLSWYLGKDNDQLILLGFLLSIMNLCLSSVTPTFFLLLEAHYGPSTLQNYEGILRNQITAPRLHNVWRLILVLMLALPVGLSVAYKTFTGGESRKMVHASHYIKNDTYYGMFGPPGLDSIGQRIGLAMFFNATLPFAEASTMTDDTEPALPDQLQTYGFNTLVLSNESVAVLDIPQPAYITAVQSLLADGESWNISASVYGTVATLNATQAEKPNAWKKSFEYDCEVAQNASAVSTQSLFNGWEVILIDYPGYGNQTRQYIGLPPTDGTEGSCANLSTHVSQFDVTRRPCRATWKVARGSFSLLQGECSDSDLSAEKQEIFTGNNLALGDWFISALAELLGPFASPRNGSDWTIPSYANVVATMMWARVTGLNGATNPGADTYSGMADDKAGLLYIVDDAVWYIRPTLRKSAGLCAILAVQPFLLLLILVLTYCMFSAPIGKGFGLTAILSGVDSGSLKILRGAAFSGQLRKDVKLSLQPMLNGDNINIRYSLLPSGMAVRNGKIAPSTKYY